MKKIVTVFMCIFYAFSTFAAANAKISEYKSIDGESGYRILNGFDFENYSKSSVGLEAITKAEISTVLNDKSTAGKKYAVVGYSQGGARALAYSKILKEQNPSAYKNLSAVITVSGIDKGIKALEGGFGPFKSRLSTDISIIDRGITGCTRATLLTYSIAGITYDFAKIHKNVILFFMAQKYPMLGNYILCAWNGGTERELQEIYDMMPRSSFIKKHVADTQSVNYKKKTGTESYLGWSYKKVWGVKIYYLTIKKRDVYKTYTAYKDIPRFDANLPVGYIVGTKSNTLSMLDKNDEKMLRKTCDGFETAMNIGYGIHVAKCCGLIGFLTNSYTYAQDCKKASKWLDNIDGELNELKGSSENDGLVAVESQYYPKTFYNPVTKRTEEVHSKVLGKTQEGIKRVYYNHKEIDPATNTAVQDIIRGMIKEAN